MPELREIPAGESRRVAAALLELRPHVGSTERLVAQIDAQRASGFRVVASFEPGDAEAVAVAGFRIGESLGWGRFLYVDDLVTRAAFRGRGHADALMAWLEAEARRERCNQLHLDSGVGPERADAHRFYFGHHLVISSHHFTRRLG